MRYLLSLYLLLFSHMALGAPSSVCSLAGEGAKTSEALLGALTTTPTPAFFVLDIEGKARFVPPAKVYSDILQTSDRSIVLNDVEELRFIPQTLAHSQILLVLSGKSPSDWDAEKTRKVLSVTKLLNIKVSMVWLGEKASPKTLRDLVLQSGGTNFDTKEIIQRVDQICRESLAAH